jgi:EAL domain-containing protein (putative c-di-GMP-specific phosphodiesterase class I)
MVSEQDIDDALRQRQFVPYYQPKVSLVTGRIVGAEALMRLVREDGSVVAPGDFIPVAERSARIKQLTRQMFPRLVDDLAWFGKGAALTFSFNATVQDFEDTGLTELVLQSIADKHVNPDEIEVEITETMALNASGRFLRNVLSLREAGVGLAMDDFGTGYSTVDTLSRLPFTTVKLDQGIVGRMLGSDRDAAIVRSSIRMGHEMRIGVVAEGVETPAQYEFLMDAGCNTAQGYLLGIPVPFEQFVTFWEQAVVWSGCSIGLVHMARLDHIQWHRQMTAYAIRRATLPPGAPLRAAPGYPVLLHNECSLGRWYSEAGRRFAEKAARDNQLFLISHPMFKAIDRPHAAVHEIGAELVREIQAGAGSAQIAPRLDQLRHYSLELLRRLQILEEAGMATPCPEH